MNVRLGPKIRRRGTRNRVRANTNQAIYKARPGVCLGANDYVLGRSNHRNRNRNV